MSELDKLRKEINDVDKALAELFEKRMEIAKKIGEYKKKNNLPILDVSREVEVIKNNLKFIKDEEVKEYYRKFIKEVMELSKEYQSK